MRDLESIFIVEGEKLVLEGIQMGLSNLEMIITSEAFFDQIPASLHFLE
ncbi:hypothetical protein [Serratia marcescens]|nr:hypothetical protein [Serratia marcescens]